MKKTIVLLSIATLFILSCSGPKKPNYLFLNGQQLQPLGIALTDQGIFYKNYIPNNKEVNERFPFIGFYSTNDTYLNTILYKENDTLKAENKYDSLFIKMEVTKNDFYPILIGNTKNEFSLKKAYNNEKLLPVAICMAETKLSKRSDTLVVWFKPTELIKKALPQDVKLEDYLMVPQIPN